MKSDKPSFYINPEKSTEAKFKTLKAPLTEYSKQYCFVQNGLTKNITGEFQLKKPMNIKDLSDLLRPNIYIYVGPKEQATENGPWLLNSINYFSIFFTDQSLSENIGKPLNIGNKPETTAEKSTKMDEEMVHVC